MHNLTASQPITAVNNGFLHLGPKLEAPPALDFILQKYLRENPDPERSCYSHFTTATG